MWDRRLRIDWTRKTDNRHEADMQHIGNVRQTADMRLEGDVRQIIERKTRDIRQDMWNRQEKWDMRQEMWDRGQKLWDLRHEIETEQTDRQETEDMRQGTWAVWSAPRFLVHTVGGHLIVCTQSLCICFSINYSSVDCCVLIIYCYSAIATAPLSSFFSYNFCAIALAAPRHLILVPLHPILGQKIHTIKKKCHWAVYLKKCLPKTILLDVVMSCQLIHKISYRWGIR